MISITFFALLALSMTVALVDWRRGWMLAVLCGVLQDPARKLTPGTPVVMTLSIVIVYFVVLFSAKSTLRQELADFSRRAPRIYLTAALVVLFLLLAAVNGVMTYGFGFWKVPALSLFIYAIPIPAVILGYAFIRREEQLINFFRFYSVLTAVALIGTPLEYLRVQWPALGLVALPEGYVRHLPGLQIRILSGFYRAPDIMGWHAALLTMIGIFMVMRARVLTKAWPWMLVAGWGFLNCLISGRRKAVYMVGVFAAAFVWRYVKRLTITQLVSFAAIGVILFFVVKNVSSSEESRVYAQGTATSRAEIAQRLEGGLLETIRQFGIFGAGLGTATQGVRHLLGTDQNIGWQEGGLGKLAIELGLPGLFAVALLGLALFRVLLIITRHPDEPGSSQLLRAALFGIVMANVVNFLVSAQAYSDAGLTLLTAFFLGCLLGTAALSDRAKAEGALAQQPQPAFA